MFVLFDRRQRAGDVDEHATQEFFVAADVRGHHAQLSQLVVDERVDVVVFRRLRVFILQPFRQHDELRADGVRLEARHDERFAACWPSPGQSEQSPHWFRCLN